MPTPTKPTDAEMDDVKKDLFAKEEEPAKEEKPAKKKRVMTEAQLANLAKAREKAAELRKAKAEAAKAAAEPKPAAEEEEVKVPTKEEKLHKFAEEVNEKLAKEAGETREHADESEEPAEPLKPATKRKRKSRWDEFEDGTLKVKSPEKEDGKEQEPKRRIKPEKVPEPVGPKPVKVPGRFGAPPSTYTYGDHQMLDPAKVAYNQQVAHVKRNLIYRNILPF